MDRVPECFDLKPLLVQETSQIPMRIRNYIIVIFHDNSLYVFQNRSRRIKENRVFRTFAVQLQQVAGFELQHGEGIGQRKSADGQTFFDRRCLSPDALKLQRFFSSEVEHHLTRVTTNRLIEGPSIRNFV